MKNKKNRIANPVSALSGAPASTSEYVLAALNACHASKIDTVGAARILFLIASEGPLPLARITKKLSMPFSTASRMAWHLHEQGLVEYVPHERDRRVKMITLSV